ncbi:MAG TPA: DUF4917 family protein [Chloroflexia bacterium]|jgi:hypothetical protein
MDRVRHALDGNLLNWLEVEERHSWRDLLLGNGASLVVWDGFRYGSLFKTACNTNRHNQLQLKDLELFAAFNTENFEAILDKLSTAETVCSITDPNATSARGHYINVQRALLEAVYHVHPPDHYKDANIGVFEALHEALLNYQSVYSTNYDLLVYWSIMAKDRGKGFKDYFWTGDEYFDPAKVDVWGHPTMVLYLHGGIHLARHANGRTLKRRCSWENGTLQESLWLPSADDIIPLVITEGKARDKEQAIGRSEYLTFALDSFKKHRKPLVVFGHSLGDSDAHLVNAIQEWGDVPIAISTRPDKPLAVRQKKAEMRSKFPGAELYFFDSTTHPIGSPNLKITPAKAPQLDIDYNSIWNRLVATG